MGWVPGLLLQPVYLFPLACPLGCPLTLHLPHTRASLLKGKDTCVPSNLENQTSRPLRVSCRARPRGKGGGLCGPKVATTLHYLMGPGTSCSPPVPQPALWDPSPRGSHGVRA